MNEPTLADAEWAIAEAIAGRVTWDDGTEYINVTDAAAIVAARVVEAVDRERAAWVTKIETLADEYAANGAARAAAGRPAWPNNVARDLRGLLAADDTESKP